MNRKFEGKWLNVGEIRPFGTPDLLFFTENKINYSIIDEIDYGIVLKENTLDKYSEPISQLKYLFINPNRIRIYRKGLKHTAVDDTEFETKNLQFEFEYERLIPTISAISENSIQQMKYNLKVGFENLTIEFNKILDNPEIQARNKKLNQEGTKIVLEKFDETLFISIVNNNKRGLIMPIKEIDDKKVILYGFPKEPYEIIANSVE